MTPRAPCRALAALALASACTTSPAMQDGVPSAGTPARDVVCLAPPDHAARLANIRPLRDGGWIACLAYLEGAIEADAYRELLAARTDAALLRHAADRLATLGADAAAYEAAAARFDLRLAAVAAALPPAGAAPPPPSFRHRMSGRAP